MSVSCQDSRLRCVQKHGASRGASTFGRGSPLKVHILCSHKVMDKLRWMLDKVCLQIILRTACLAIMKASKPVFLHRAKPNAALTISASQYIYYYLSFSSLLIPNFLLLLVATKLSNNHHWAASAYAGLLSDCCIAWPSVWVVFPFLVKANADLALFFWGKSLLKINTFKAFHFKPVRKRKKERKPGNADVILNEHETHQWKGHAVEEEYGWRGAEKRSSQKAVSTHFHLFILENERNVPVQLIKICRLHPRFTLSICSFNRLPPQPPWRCWNCSSKVEWHI